MQANDSRVWLNDGTGRFRDSEQVLTQQGHGVAVADLDGDGDLDLVIAGFVAGPVEIWWNRRVERRAGGGSASGSRGAPDPGACAPAQE